jgi:hypothetical protein
VRAVIAVVYAVEVLPGEHDPQVDTYERFTHALPAAPNAEILFSTGVLVAGENDVTNPDFDVDVRSHGRALESLPYQN